MTDIISIDIGTTTGILIQFYFPLTITMPCGESVTLESLEDIKNNIPCSCGDPNHWFLKWNQIIERLIKP